MNDIINLETIDNALTMSSIDLLKMINGVRKEFGEPKVENSHFLKRIEDELDGELDGPKSFRPERGGTPMKYYELTLEQCTLVGMRESKGVRRAVLAKLKELEAQQPQFRELTREQKMAYALISASEIIEEQKAEIKQLSASLKVEHQIANIARAAVVMGDADIQLTKFAKSIEDSFTRDNGAPLGRTTFYKILRDWDILTQENLATGYASARKWSLVKQSGFYMRGDKKVPNLICYITPKGQEYIINRLYQDKEELGLTIKEYN